MKDAKGHGSNGRGGLSPTEQKMADHGSRVLGAIGAMGIAAQHGIPTAHLDYGSGHTVSRITLGGKIKETMSGADYARSGGKFPSDR